MTQTGAYPGFSKGGVTEASHQIVMSTSRPRVAALPRVSAGAVVLSLHEGPY